MRQQTHKFYSLWGIHSGILLAHLLTALHLARLTNVVHQSVSAGEWRTKPAECGVYVGTEVRLMDDWAWWQRFEMHSKLLQFIRSCFIAFEAATLHSKRFHCVRSCSLRSHETSGKLFYVRKREILQLYCDLCMFEYYVFWFNNHSTVDSL